MVGRLVVAHDAKPSTPSATTSTAASPYKVCITGAAGQIAYSLFPHICSGATFGADKPVILHLLDIEMATEALKGVKMELEDAAYPLLQGISPAPLLPRLSVYGLGLFASSSDEIGW